MNTITVVIELIRTDDQLHVEVNVRGADLYDPPSTVEIVGLIELAKVQYIQDKLRS